MSFDHFLKKHLILSIGNEAGDIYRKLRSGNDITEILVDDPYGFIDTVLQSGWYITYVLWWDRARIAEGSSIGMGGPRDPRNPETFYFAEVVHLDKHFDIGTTREMYREYLNNTLYAFPGNDLYPGFDIQKRVFGT